MKSNRRLYLLGGFLIAVLLVYVGVLYNTQIRQYDYYLAQSVRTIAREEAVEASRGVITDRNGKALVSNRSTYNLTFDSSLLKAEDDENTAILRLLTLCRQQEISWVDNLPITKTAPFSYTIDLLSDTQKNRFLTYLKAQKLVAAGLTAENLTGEMLTRAGLDPTALLTHMRKLYEIPGIFSLSEGRAVLGVQYELALRKLDNYTAYVLAEDIDLEMISLLNDGGYSGAKITSSTVREYKTSYAAHVLGTVGPIYKEDYHDTLKEQGYKMDDVVGKSGAESAFEQYLRGTDGRRIVSTNSDGKITSELYSKAPQPGNTVELTLDLDLQKAVEDALAETVEKMTESDGITRGAGAAVIQVGSGEVLSLASYPTFDLSTYRQTYIALRDGPAKPLFNRATNGTYAPGSTFKMCTAVAALESGVITPTTKIRDTGRFNYPGTDFSLRCWIYPGSHGLIDVTEAIRVSCNSFFCELGYRLGIDRLDEYATAFGLGQSTGIEIGDAKGVLAGPAHSADVDQIWYGGNTVQAAIGQSDHLFTPIQLANYVATLVSGGEHYDAHLLKAAKSYDNTAVLAVGQSEPNNTVSISASTLNAVKQGMYELTTSGGLSSYFRNCVVDAGAKTGTAQISKETKNNGVFVCFAPYENPEVALAIVIEKGGSGSALASTAVKILNAYFSADEIGTVIVGEQQLLR